MLRLELGDNGTVLWPCSCFQVEFCTSDFSFLVRVDVGFRTIHQVEPKNAPALVARPNGDAPGHASNKTTNDSVLQQSNGSPEISEVLMIPRFILDNGHSETENCN